MKRAGCRVCMCGNGFAASKNDTEDTAMKNTLLTFVCYLILGVFLLACTSRAQAAGTHPRPFAAVTLTAGRGK